MGAAQIQAKIKKGLAKAVSKTGSASSELVYLMKRVTTAGTPLAPGTTTTTQILLPNAIFKNYDAKVFDVNILAGDRQLVCDNATPIKQGDIIKQGASNYLVMPISVNAPTSDVLNYVVQVRLQ